MALMFTKFTILFSLPIFCSGFPMWTDISEFVPIIDEYKDCLVVLTLFEKTLTNVQSLAKVSIPVERSLLGDGREKLPAPFVASRHFKKVRNRLNCYAIFVIYPEDYYFKVPKNLKVHPVLRKILDPTETFVKTYIHVISKYGGLIHNNLFYENFLRSCRNIRVVTHLIEMTPTFTSLEHSATSLYYFVGYDHQSILSVTSISCKEVETCRGHIEDAFNNITNNGRRIMHIVDINHPYGYNMTDKKTVVVTRDRNNLHGYHFNISDRCRTELPTPFDLTSIQLTGKSMQQLFAMLLFSTSTEVLAAVEKNCISIYKASNVHFTHAITKNFELYVTVAGNAPIKYVTCDGISNYLSFEFYVMPYDIASWSFILSFGFIFLPVSLALMYYRFDQKSSELFYRNLTVMMFTYAVLLEQGNNLPSKMISLGQYWKYPLGTWMIIGVILTNAYRSLVVARVALPLPLLQAYTTFDQLSYFTMFTDYSSYTELIDHYKELRRLKVSNELTVLTPQEKHCLCNPDKCKSKAIFGSLRNQLLCRSHHRSCNNTETMPILYSRNVLFWRTRKMSSRYNKLGSHMLFANLLGIYSHYSDLFLSKKNCLFYELSSNCYKTAILGTESELAGFMVYVQLLQSNGPKSSTIEICKPTWNKNKKPVYKQGKEILYERLHYMHFKGYKAPLYYNRFQRSFFASGIYNLFKKWSKIIQPNYDDLLIKEDKLLDTERKLPTKVKLDSNIITSFYVLGCGVAGCLFIFFVEIRIRCLISIVTILAKRLKSVTLPFFKDT